MISNSLVVTLTAMAMASGVSIDVVSMAKEVALLEGNCAPEQILYARIAKLCPTAIADVAGVAFYTPCGCIYVSQDGNVVICKQV